MKSFVSAPQPDQIEELQHRVFGKILDSEFCSFRENPAPVYMSDNRELCRASEIADRLRNAAAECGDVTKSHTIDGERPARTGEMLEKVARYNSALMKTLPCKDDPENPIINRTVAAVVLESHLERCFLMEHLHRSIDAKKYQEAVHHHHEFASDRRLCEAVKEIIGPSYNVERLDHHRTRGPSLSR